MTPSRPLLSALALALMAAIATGAAAQAPATKSLGDAKAGTKLLTREELRACMALQKDLAGRKPQLERERVALDKEHTELQKIDESLKADDAAMKKLAQTAESITQRTKDLQQQLADYNDKVAKFQSSNPSGPTGERQRRALDNEKASLDKATAQLEADRKTVGPDAEKIAKTYSARVETRNQAAADWNTRNQAMAKKAQGYELDLDTWKGDCEGRSYREDDEKAIQAGR